MMMMTIIIIIINPHSRLPTWILDHGAYYRSNCVGTYLAQFTNLLFYFGILGRKKSQFHVQLG